MIYKKYTNQMLSLTDKNQKCNLTFYETQIICARLPRFYLVGWTLLQQHVSRLTNPNSLFILQLYATHCWNLDRVSGDLFENVAREHRVRNTADNPPIRPLRWDKCKVDIVNVETGRSKIVLTWITNKWIRIREFRIKNYETYINNG